MKFFENFHFFGTFFEGRASFKGMKHVTPSPAKSKIGTKMFVKTRATILAMKDIYGLKRWHLAANLLKKIHKTTPPGGENFSKIFFWVYFIERFQTQKNLSASYVLTKIVFFGITRPTYDSYLNFLKVASKSIVNLFIKLSNEGSRSKIRFC